MIRFIHECVDYDGTVLQIPMTITQDGVLSWEGYDPEPARAWKALSGERTSYPSCLDAIEIWEAAPVNFLLKYSPASLNTSVRVGADFAKHAWTHSSTEIPHRSRQLLEYIGSNPPTKGSANWVASWLTTLESTDLVDIRACGDTAATWAVGAIETLARSFIAAGRRSARAYSYLIGTAVDAQQAAKGDRKYPPEYMRRHGYAPEELEEQAWQVRHFVRALEAVEKREPWPSL